MADGEGTESATSGQTFSASATARACEVDQATIGRGLDADRPRIRMSPGGSGKISGKITEPKSRIPQDLPPLSA